MPILSSAARSCNPVGTEILAVVTGSSTARESPTLIQYSTRVLAAISVVSNFGCDESRKLRAVLDKGSRAEFDAFGVDGTQRSERKALISLHFGRIAKHRDVARAHGLVGLQPRE